MCIELVIMSRTPFANILSNFFESSKAAKPCDCCNSNFTTSDSNNTSVEIVTIESEKSNSTFEESREARVVANYFRIPKFLQAILTLLICAILLSTTLCIILKLRQRCSNQKQPCESDDVTETQATTQNEEEAGHLPKTNVKHNGSQRMTSIRNKSVKFQRRASGPFADDTIAFVKETYKKPTILNRTGVMDEELIRPHSA